MYISGTQYNLLNRLKQLPVTAEDLGYFQAEFDGYTFSSTIQEYRCLRELNRKIAIIGEPVSPNDFLILDNDDYLLVDGEYLILE